MGIFGDLKAFGSATAKALGHGAEWLADAAESLEKSTHVLALRASIKNLEFDLEPPRVERLSAFQRKERQQEILQLCKEIIELVGERRAADIVEKRQALEACIRKQSIEEGIAGINRKKERAATLQFRLPIDEIRHLQSLVYSCTNLISLLKAEGNRSWEQRASQLAEETEARIAELQLRRATQEESFYPSGIRESLIRKYDDLRQGLSEYWYENGAPRLAVEFKGGKVNGAVRLHAPSGHLVGEGRMCLAEGIGGWRVYLDPERRVAAIDYSQGQGALKMWLWNGVYAGKAIIRSGKVRRKGFFLCLLLRPRVWMSLWRARKPGKDRDELLRMAEYMELWEVAQAEVLAMQVPSAASPKLQSAVDKRQGTPA